MIKTKNFSEQRLASLLRGYIDSPDDEVTKEMYERATAELLADLRSIVNSNEMEWVEIDSEAYDIYKDNKRNNS